MTSRFSTHLVRRDEKEPWGLRISGGRDFGAPVTISRVVPNGVAERGGVRVGDRFVQVAGQDAGEMCHRDAQMAIKTAGYNLQLELERSGPAPAPTPEVAKGIQQLEIRGSAPPPPEPPVNLHGANSTAQPWKARKSIDGAAQETSGFRPVARAFPPPSTQSSEVNSGFRPISSSLPPPSSTVSGSEPAPGFRASSNEAGRSQEAVARRADHTPFSYEAPVLAKVEESHSALSDSGLRKTDHAPYSYKAPVVAKVEESHSALSDSGLRKTDHASYSYQIATATKVGDSASADSAVKRKTPSTLVDDRSSALHDSGLRKTDHAPYRYQPTETIDPQRKSSAPVNSIRFQAPSSGHRGSEPSVTPYQKDFTRKGSDCFPVPFSASFKPTSPNGPPPVLPKPPTEQRKSFDRGPVSPPRSYGSTSPPAAPAAPAAPAPVAHDPPASSQNTDKNAKSDRAPAVCYHCKETVRGPYLMALDRIYCPDHFRCVKCDAQLGKQPFISHQGNVYCLNDYREHVAPRCAKCGEPVEEQQLLAMDQVYHPHCFVCNMCKKPMAKGSFRIGTDKMPYCEEDWKQHFQVVCGRCNFPIEADEQFIDASANNYHVDCFVCTTCLTKLEGKAFYLRNEQPYCKDHIKAAY